VAETGLHLLERLGKALRVPGDQRLPRVGLGREVVVQGGLGDPQFRRDVGVAEVVQPTHQPLGRVEDS
jgi:hypothetical protein